MPDKKSIILESVRKLIALDLSDSEIIKNLREVGIDSKDARKILDEVKGIKPSKPKMKLVEKPLPKPDFEPNEDDFMGPLPDSEDELLKKLEAGVEDPEDKRQREAWEKAVMHTVNQKVQEMKSLKKDLDAVLDKKVKAGLDKEYKKIQILLNSKSTLLSEKLRTQLDTKKQEVDELLAKRVEDIVRINQDMKQSLLEIEQWETKHKTMHAEIQEIDMKIQRVKSEGLDQLYAKSKESVQKLEQYSVQTKKAINEGLELTKKQINERIELTLKDIDSKIGTATREISIAKQLAEKEIRKESLTAKNEFKQALQDNIKELDLALAERREKHVDELDAVLTQRFGTAEKEFSGLRQKLFSETHTTLKDSRKEVEEFIAKAQSEIKRLDSRVTKTLELESEVIEDVMNEAREKIERVKFESERDLKAQIAEEIRKFKILQKEIDPDKTKARIAEIEKARDRIRVEVTRRMAEQLQKIEREYDSKITARLGSLDRKTAESETKLDSIVRSAEAKSRELGEINKRIDSRVKERLNNVEKEYATKVKPKLDEMDKVKTGYQNATVETGRRISEMEKTKAKMISQINSEMIKSKTEMKQSTELYRKELKTMTQQAAMLLNQKQALIKGLEPYTKMDLNQIRKQVAEAAYRQTEMSLNAKAKMNIQEMEKAKEQARRAALHAVGADEIQARVKELNLFKVQFLKAIDANIGQFNSRIQNFNKTTKLMEQQFNTRIKMLDQKMDELYKFEKNFATAIGSSLNKMQKANAVKPVKK